MGRNAKTREPSKMTSCDNLTWIAHMWLSTGELPEHANMTKTRVKIKGLVI